jgi:ribulose bisphosphate carboxylase small subunit
VHLLHTGWRDTAEWEEARQWFQGQWKQTPTQLAKTSIENPRSLRFAYRMPEFKDGKF